MYPIMSLVAHSLLEVPYVTCQSAFRTRARRWSATPILDTLRSTAPATRPARTLGIDHLVGKSDRGD